ncbi:hypothetical protein [Paraburkholderia sp.]|uniref:hypothetical protein n=1 Tax=Paraburkholderia sp. TaxID=1926495 RepID=UPI003D6FBCF4
MSEPDNSNSKAPPSLLSDTEKGAQANGSRILANLEGRVAPPSDKPRRSRAPVAIVALLVIAAGGWGAWQLQHRAGHSEVVASTAAPAQNAASNAVATPASGTAQVAAKAADSVASAPQTATIIADDTTDKDTKTSADAASGASDDSRLSRALASGAQDASGTAPAASAAAIASTRQETSTVASNATKHDAAHAKHEAANARHAGASTTVAQAKKSAHDTRAGSRDDSDADLLAALVARTKPADAQAAPAKTGNTATSKSAPHASRTGAPATPGTPAGTQLAQRVKECSEQGFFEEQFCRWRVCDGHWGKDPACPNASQTRQP